MECDRYLELLALSLDGALSGEEERELKGHLACCPACRTAGAQLAALRPAFSELEEVPAPEGFAQGVMERIRTEAKVVPLFRRSRFRTLAGLAACLAVVVGLYGAARVQPQTARGADWSQGSFQPDALTEDTPMIAAYAAPGDPVEGAQNSDEKSRILKAAPMSNAQVLTLDRMPEGGWELIPPETPVSPEGLLVTEELFEEIDQLAEEQGISASRASGDVSSEQYVIVILEESE